MHICTFNHRCCCQRPANPSASEGLAISSRRSRSGFDRWQDKWRVQCHTTVSSFFVLPRQLNLGSRSSTMVPHLSRGPVLQPIYKYDSSLCWQPLFSAFGRKLDSPQMLQNGHSSMTPDSAELDLYG